MPELPDVTVYVEAMRTRVVGHKLDRAVVRSPFLLRTADPPLSVAIGGTVHDVRRLGKQIAIGVAGDLWLVLHLMIALCAGCHAKVHRTKVVLTEFPPLLLVLWREQHPEGHEQTYIDFNVRKPPAQSVPLNFEPARKD